MDKYEFQFKRSCQIKPHNSNELIKCNMNPGGRNCDYSVFVTGLPAEWSLKEMVNNLQQFGPILCFYLEGAKNDDGSFNDQFSGNGLVK